METIVQLQDEKTGNNVAPITHWDAVSNKPDLVTRSELSDVAKQGDNPDVSLTSVDEKIDDFYDTFDADIALQLQGIIGDTDESESESESIEGTSQTEEQVNALRTLQESYNELSANLQTLVDAHVINNINMSGWTFSEDVVPDNTVYSMTSYLSEVIRIVDNTTEHGGVTFPNGLQKLQYIEMNSLDVMPSLYNCTALVEAYFASAESIYFGNGGTNNLEILYIPNVFTIRGAASVTLGQKLIDITTGKNFNTGCRVLAAWSPTEALRSDTNSLVKSGEPFANNLEKLLYNIRKHIAANLQDRTDLSAFTIIFSSAVKAAILADTDTANAFADKNWTVA